MRDRFFAATAFPRTQRNRARRSDLEQGLRRLGLAIDMYRVEHDDAYPQKLAQLEGGYLGEENRIESFNRYGCRAQLVIPDSDDPDEAVLYYWPPFEGGTAILYQSSEVDWAEFAADGSLTNPRNGEVIRPAHMPEDVPADVLAFAARVGEAIAGYLPSAIGRARSTSWSDSHQFDLIFHFFVSGPSFRHDRQVLSWTIDGEDRSGSYLVREAFTPEATYSARRYDREQGALNFGTVVPPDPIVYRRSHGGVWTGVVFNPRWLLVPGMAFSNSEDGSLTAGIEHLAASGMRFRLEGDPEHDVTVAVVWEDPRGVSRRDYFNTDSLLPVRSEVVPPDGERRTTRTWAYERHEPSGRLLLRRFRSSSEKLDIQLQYATVDEPVPPELFTRDGLSLGLEDVVPEFAATPVPPRPVEFPARHPVLAPTVIRSVEGEGDDAVAWRVERGSPVRIVHGFYTTTSEGTCEYAGGGISHQPSTEPLELQVTAERDGEGGPPGACDDPPFHR
jgi:hypothetical protein